MIVVSVLTVAMLSALWPTVMKPAVETMLQVGSCVEDRLVDSSPLAIEPAEIDSGQPVQVAGGPLHHWSRTLRSHHLGD